MLDLVPHRACVPWSPAPRFAHLVAGIVRERREKREDRRRRRKKLWFVNQWLLLRPELSRGMTFAASIAEQRAQTGPCRMRLYCRYYGMYVGILPLRLHSRVVGSLRAHKRAGRAGLACSYVDGLESGWDYVHEIIIINSTITINKMEDRRMEVCMYTWYVGR